jgi:hypothetical protein
MQPTPVTARSNATTARLLGLRVRNPPRTWMSVVSVVLSGKVSASGRSLVQRCPTIYVCVCVTD